MERQQRIRIEALENDLRRRQTSYIRRERAYKAKIEELERQLTVARRGGGSDETEGKMAAIRATHEKIIENIEKMQSTTAALMKEQEADLLRQFRVRLFDVQEELVSAKAKANDENAAVWIKKYRSLEKEMEWVKALADKLEQSNKTLEKENQRLHQNFKSQEEDRGMLVKQLVLVKKDNVRLQQEIQELKEKVSFSLCVVCVCLRGSSVRSALCV
jgi:chromosome segregation ATPase